MLRFRFYVSGMIFLAVCAAFSAVQISARSVGGFCFGDDFDLKNSRVVETPTDGGIREIIEEKYRSRYEKWKSELLSTDFGREQWDKYSANKNFILTVKIKFDEKNGAGTTDYLWDKNGNLVGATIILGAKIGKGYPDPIYFPVVNSLSVNESEKKSSENILAAAKIAHEFGHINQTAKIGGDAVNEQNKLMSEYNEIFKAAGYAMNDKRLEELKQKLGGTPVEIWANREYWGEANAMSYLIERVGKEDFYCSMINRIEKNLKTFAPDYEDRFQKIIENSAACRK